jgi:putative hydrolase of HD superfamily
MSENVRADMQLKFIITIDTLKAVQRRVYIGDGSRRENTAEHSWHIALMARVLAEYAPPGTNIDRVVALCLNHDIVEIQAGDASIYDEKARAEAALRERDAANFLYAQLPPDQGRQFKADWEEFEHGTSNEAKFARALDRLQPMILNFITHGRAWKEQEATRERVEQKCKSAITAGASTYWHLCVIPLLNEAEKQGFFAPASSPEPSSWKGMETNALDGTPGG